MYLFESIILLFRLPAPTQTGTATPHLPSPRKFPCALHIEPGGVGTDDEFGGAETGVGVGAGFHYAEGE